MKAKALLLAAAIAAAGPACAEWLEVHGDAGITWFMDYSSLRVNGYNRRIWLLRDYVLPKNDKDGSYQSVKTFEEFDCNEDRNRLLQFTAYSKKQGGGRPIFSSSIPGEWRYNTPETSGKTIADAICGLPAK